MSKSKGIQVDPIFKLGRGPTRRDHRNLRFAAILRQPIKVPTEYDFDLEHPGIPTPMFANDVYGCCIIAGRAHQTLRFEKLEQNVVLKITDREVIKEYLKETNGVDSGSILLESLKRWRKLGWIAARSRYRIQAFSELEVSDTVEIKRAIYIELGVGLGLALPKSAIAQINAGKPWDIVRGRIGAPNSWGGHYVFVPGYTELGPVCVTWGRKQQMTWDFVSRYCEEAYAVIDAINTPKKRRALDTAKLDAYLSHLA